MDNSEKREHEEREKSGFRVVDHRHFDAQGKVRDKAVENSPPASTSKAEPSADNSASKQSAPQSSATGSNRIPHESSPADREAARQAYGSGGAQMDFAHFCLSLAGSAQVALGLVAHPESKIITKDPNTARQTIDIIAMLQEKTKGNLSKEEEGLLEELLYTLRMQYVQATNAPTVK